VFSFASTSTTVNESEGEIKLTVNRFVGARGRVSVPYRTIEGTAKDGTDFVSTSGKLIFDNNEASKDITVKIVDSEAYEKNEYFK
jgi:solute carrier family 8 (sodium/calcium exchanger)